jgi:hypothetical protein
MPKKSKGKKGLGYTSVVEHVITKHKALGSTPSPKNKECKVLNLKGWLTKQNKGTEKYSGFKF